MREVISVHVGQAGVQIGNANWELYCLEHNLDKEGKISSNGEPPSEGFRSYFDETPDGSYVPRAIMVDLEPTVIDEVRNGPYKNLYNNEQLVSAKEDAANNFARGRYTIGQIAGQETMEVIRRQAENCDRLQGLVFFHSFGGGTGSGLTTFLMGQMCMFYRKISMHEFVIFPSPQLSTAVVDPYNTVLAASATMDQVDCSFLADNQAMFRICVNNLGIEQPSYLNLNRLLSQAISSVTASQRFTGSLNADFVDFQTNLVPYPRIHFPLINYAPIASTDQLRHQSGTVREITESCFENSHQLVECDTNAGKYMACCLLYRGDVTPKDVNDSINVVKNKKGIGFVNWSPTGFKVGINCEPPTMVPGGDMPKLSRAVCMLSNTTAVGGTWAKLSAKFDAMYQKRAFTHWYREEGLDIEEFEEAKENIHALLQDYAEVEVLS